jgi:hypothetical protein
VGGVFLFRLVLVICGYGEDLSHHFHCESWQLNHRPSSGKWHSIIEPMQ